MLLKYLKSQMYLKYLKNQTLLKYLMYLKYHRHQKYQTYLMYQKNLPDLELNHLTSIHQLQSKPIVNRRLVQYKHHRFRFQLKVSLLVLLLDPASKHPNLDYLADPFDQMYQMSLKYQLYLKNQMYLSYLKYQMLLKYLMNQKYQLYLKYQT